MIVNLVGELSAQPILLAEQSSQERQKVGEAYTGPLVMIIIEKMMIVILKMMMMMILKMMIILVKNRHRGH